MKGIPNSQTFLIHLGQAILSIACFNHRNILRPLSKCSDLRKDTSSDITFNLCYIALNNKQNRTVFGVTDSKSGFHDCLRGRNKPHIRYSSLNSWIYLFFKSEQLEGVLWYRVFKMARTKCTYEFFVIQVLLRSITLGSITSYMYQIYIFAVIYLRFSLAEHFGLEHLKRTKKWQTVN